MATPGSKTEKAEKPKNPIAQPDFTLKILDFEELPEPAPRSRTHSYTEINTNLLKLQETPNKWGVVAVYKGRPGSDAHPSGAKKVVMKFLDGTAKPPASGDDGGEYNLEWRNAADVGLEGGGTVVLARYEVDAS